MLFAFILNSANLALPKLLPRPSGPRFYLLIQTYWPSPNNSDQSAHVRHLVFGVLIPLAANGDLVTMSIRGCVRPTAPRLRPTRIRRSDNSVENLVAANVMLMIMLELLALP